MSNTTSRAPRRSCWRAVFLALWLTVSLTASSCGGAEQAEPPPGPTLPAAVAEDLAARSDRVADLLAAGDVCGAAHAADDLQAAFVAAVNADRVPAELQEELGNAAATLVNEVNCPPPAEEEDEDRGKGKGRDKKKGRDD